MKFNFTFLLICVIFISCEQKTENQNTNLIKEESTIKVTHKEDPLNMYNAENISKVDMLEALDVLGIQIHKIKFNEFTKKQNILLLVEEFEQGVLKNTDTLSLRDNLYYESFDEDGSPNIGFIDQIKFITNTENEESKLIVKTYKGQIAKTKIKLKKTNDNQFFLWRNYLNTEWTINKKVPLMIFASSWFDKNINNHRFCGVAKLTENTESTDELLNNSPNYILISYKVSD